MVSSGVYRSGYPNRKNFSFLQKLELKCVIYLCPEPLSDENKMFFESLNTKIIHIKIKGNKEPFQEIQSCDVEEALVQIQNKENRPVLVHCNKGKHRVGCVIGCFRKTQNWAMVAIFEEFRRFSGEKIRVADEEFIELFNT